MLQFASRTLQRFLTGTVPPPAPDVRPHDWVRLGRLDEDGDADDEDTLVLHLFHVGLDPLTRSGPAKPGGAARREALFVDLRYAVGYRSSNQELVESALGSVLRAFHSRPSLAMRDYLSPSELERWGDQLPGRLDVSLDTPSDSMMESLWRSSPKAVGLSLYYLVRSLPIPPHEPERARGVERAHPPEPAPLASGGGA